MSEKTIECGAAYFKGGLDGIVSVFDSVGTEYKIRIPPKVKYNSTEEIHISVEDSYRVWRG